MPKVEERLASVEPEVARLKVRSNEENRQPWWERIRGTFKEDPDYDEAMRLRPCDAQAPPNYAAARRFPDRLVAERCTPSIQRQLAPAM
jgi:hypothetical protein